MPEYKELVLVFNRALSTIDAHIIRIVPLDFTNTHAIGVDTLTTMPTAATSPRKAAKASAIFAHVGIWHNRRLSQVGSGPSFFNCLNYKIKEKSK